ncbi:TROVE domain-containing protein [Aquisalinus luteolus]|uniref:TROVE domain-containing protein n=1 Tax=Aquisalinus luteolus TaxID=1566827 RepID=UPI00197D1D35|nr:TROVE domain-containing protein [Aquisalinus luteolus]
MKLNTPPGFRGKTHAGGQAHHVADSDQLRRAVLSCLLWEDQFYESGEHIADRIERLALERPASEVAALAIEARDRFNLRHAPLMLLSALARTARGTSILADTMPRVMLRADEMGEFLSIYWRKGKQPISAQIKRGLRETFVKFDAYQLAKYNRASAVKLRDILFLVHPKPKDAAQQAVWNSLVDGTLASPDTWEVSLSAGADKRETFERLLREGKLGYLALLRNLRNMSQAGVDAGLVRDAILARRGAQHVLPFRYVAAARHAPAFEPYLDQALSEAMAEMSPLDGKTVVLVDVSASMECALSRRSDMTRLDAAAALGAIVHGDLRVFTFSGKLVEVAPRRGMAGVDAIINSQVHYSTYLRGALQDINARVPYDRIIVVTDEQSHDGLCDPVAPKAYMINVASYEPGISYGPWTRINGFSESVIRYIHEAERTA